MKAFESKPPPEFAEFERMTIQKITAALGIPPHVGAFLRTADLMTVDELKSAAKSAVDQGGGNLVLTFPRGTSGVCLLGRRGPKGTLVCVNREGGRVLAFNARRVLEFIESETASN